VRVDPPPAVADQTRMIICGLVVGLVYLAFRLAHRAAEAEPTNTETD
jgi:hypothetical protein